MSRPLCAVTVSVSDLLVFYLRSRATDYEFIQLDVAKLSLRSCPRLAFLHRG